MSVAEEKFENNNQLQHALNGVSVDDNPPINEVLSDMNAQFSDNFETLQRVLGDVSRDLPAATTRAYAERPFKWPGEGTGHARIINHKTDNPQGLARELGELIADTVNNQLTEISMVENMTVRNVMKGEVPDSFMPDSSSTDRYLAVSRVAHYFGEDDPFTKSVERLFNVIDDIRSDSANRFADQKGMNELFRRVANGRESNGVIGRHSNGPGSVTLVSHPNSKFVSGKHAAVQPGERGIEIRDLGSTNGTFKLEGGEWKRLEPNKPYELLAGDTIKIDRDVHTVPDTGNLVAALPTVQELALDEKIEMSLQILRVGDSITIGQEGDFAITEKPNHLDVKHATITLLSEENGIREYAISDGTPERATVNGIYVDGMQHREYGVMRQKSGARIGLPTNPKTRFILP